MICNNVTVHVVHFCVIIWFVLCGCFRLIKMVLLCMALSACTWVWFCGVFEGGLPV